MTGNEESFRLEVPEPVQSEVIEAVESSEFPDWFYPKTLDETLDEYVGSRQGKFDSIGFTVFPESETVSVHYDDPVNTPPQELLDAIEETRRPVYSEDYTIRFSFESESWDNVEDVWIDVYRVIDEPADML